MTGERTGERTGSRVGPVLYVVLLVLVFLPGFVLTALRVMQPDTGRGVAVVALAPFALPVYAVLALLALLGLVGRRRAARRVPAAVALLAAVAGLAVHASWLAPAYRGDRPPPAAGARPFSVLTLNLHRGGADPAAVAAAARRGVDVLVLVEVTPASLDALDAAGLADAFPSRGGEAEPNVGGTMILSTGAVTDVARLDTRHGSWAATVRLPGGSRRVWAVHPRRPQEAGDGWRDDLLDLRGDLRTMPAPDVVAGDFNATADHARFRDLLTTGLRDSAELLNAGWKPTWPANGDVHGLPRFVPIDHVLIGPSLTALATHRVDVPDTDHSGVWAQLAER